MSRIVELEIFEFSELSTEAQEKAIDEEIERRTMDETLMWPWRDGVKNDLVKIHGLDLEDFGYSLGYCQSDGVVFVGGFENLRQKMEDLDLLPVADFEYRMLSEQTREEFWNENFGIKFKGRDPPSHVELTYFGYDIEGIDVDWDDYCERVKETLNEWARNLCREIEKSGDENYEYLTDRDTVKTDLEASGNEYLVDGERYS